VEGGEAPGEALGDAVITQIAAFADHARRLDLAGLDDAGRIARVVERMGIADARGRLVGGAGRGHPLLGMADTVGVGA
jgi:hypothetical protein